MIRRRIDLPSDRQAVVELHCEINHACESRWVQDVPYPLYREKWIDSAQPDGFTSDLQASLEDPRTVAEVWCDGDLIVGYLWVTFTDVQNYEFVIAEVRDVAVHRRHRRKGLGSRMMAFAEETARSAGAHVLRSGTGAENPASCSMHEKHGYNTYRVEYEKILMEPPPF
ncbi:MAG: GNAT family N-acetyltransferase [Candidatus Latescibacterota bacterium]